MDNRQLEEEEKERRRKTKSFQLQAVALSIDPRLQGDQLRLPSWILERILNDDGLAAGGGSTEPKSPMVFSLKTETRTVFGTPKEFTAQGPRDVCLSLSHALALGVVEPSPKESSGSSAEIETDTAPANHLNATLERMELPRGSFVRLAPLTPNYLEIPDIR